MTPPAVASGIPWASMLKSRRTPFRKKVTCPPPQTESNGALWDGDPDDCAHPATPRAATPTASTSTSLRMCHLPIPLPRRRSPRHAAARSLCLWSARVKRQPGDRRSRLGAGAYHDAVARTLFEKVWDEHVVVEPDGEPALLYVDLHLVHEVAS